MLQNKKIIFASDHTGVELKSYLINYLVQWGCQVDDLGPEDEKSVDYPDYAQKIVHGIEQKNYQWGILICGTGVGMSIAANRSPCVRAILGQDELTVRLSRQHNNANVLCLGSRVLGNMKALSCLKIFLETKFDHDERHCRRIEKISSSG